MGVSPREIAIARKLYRTVIGALLGLSLIYALAFMLLINYQWREYREAERAVSINYVTDGKVLDAAIGMADQHAVKDRDKARRNLIVLTGALIAGLMLAVLVFLAVRRAVAAMVRLQTVGVMADITDHKHIEAALKESEERFRQFSESINVGFWILDSNPRCVTYVNRAFTQMSGLEADEVYRSPVPRIDVVHEDDRQTVKLAFEEWLQGEPSSLLEIDYRIVRPDGEMRWIHDHGVKLQDENGQTFRILGISEDITDRKRTDEAIKAMSRALEQKAGELATVNRELEAFAYSVSHDLRAPLRHVDGYLSLLQKRVSPLLDETSQRYLATISKATERMASLIDDLLAFSRMGRTELNKTVVPLNRLIKDVIGELKTETENRHIDWIVKPLPDVFVDAALFRQVFFSLIENAVKYTRPRPQARIEIGCINDDGNEAIIFVSDNGVGFDMKYVDKLFGVFQRLHRAEEFEGTGIGLANVARIIQRHGGRVWAVGDKDKGATFYVAIPLEEKDK
ncbi:MAG: PAS domain S-box protein [Burkholderiales bacterium]|nr:PAS domain S-box protein [Burkholderiales bacterium]